MEIPAHKMVLSACSPYFYAMFSGGDFEESRQDKITVQGVDYHALQLLIEYVYTAIVEVTEDNVQVSVECCAILKGKNLFSKTSFVELGSLDCGQFVAIDRRP